MENKKSSILNIKINGIISQFVLAFLFQSFFSTNIFAQGIEIKAEFDTTSILIGDQIHLNILIDQPQDAKIVFPNLSDTLVSKVEILSSSKTDTNFIGNGRLKLLKRYLVTCFDSGVYQIPPLKFTFQTGSGRDTLATMPLALAVNTLPIKDSKKIFDIKEIINVPFSFDEILPYIVIILGLLLIVVIVAYVVIRLRQNKPVFFRLKPVEPAHIRAFRELEKLKNEKLWQQGLIKQYYTTLTDIIRTYIEGRFKVMALESTSDEIIGDLKGIEIINEENLKELKRLLVLADLVKFAKGDPLPDENDNAWKIAYNFVLKTLIKPEVEAEQTVTSNEVAGT